MAVENKTSYSIGLNSVMHTSSTLAPDSALENFLGESLIEIRYWCLKEEATEEDLLFPDFYHGGAIVLSFGTNKSLFITWSEDHEYDSHYCLVLREEIAWDPAYYREFNASSIALWKSVIGQSLKQVHFLGWSDIPFVCALTFETETLYIGLSDGHTFADSNDIIVKDHPSFWLTPYMEDIRLID